MAEMADGFNQCEIKLGQLLFLELDSINFTAFLWCRKLYHQKKTTYTRKSTTVSRTDQLDPVCEVCAQPVLHSQRYYNLFSSLNFTLFQNRQEKFNLNILKQKTESTKKSNNNQPTPSILSVIWRRPWPPAVS